MADQRGFKSRIVFHTGRFGGCHPPPLKVWCIFLEPPSSFFFPLGGFSVFKPQGRFFLDKTGDHNNQLIFFLFPKPPVKKVPPCVTQQGGSPPLGSGPSPQFELLRLLLAQILGQTTHTPHPSPPPREPAEFFFLHPPFFVDWEIFLSFFAVVFFPGHPLSPHFFLLDKARVAFVLSQGFLFFFPPLLLYGGFFFGLLL